MGQLDQLAKQIFAEETEEVTRGAVTWQAPVEIGLSDVRLDGMLLVRDPASLLALPAPWSEAGAYEGDLVIEIKMPGDHLDTPSFQRALLRRQARQVQRAEDPEAPWDGEEPLWLVAPHVPAFLHRKRSLGLLAPGATASTPRPFRSCGSPRTTCRSATSSSPS